jgi:hypothetical protein
MNPAAAGAQEDASTLSSNDTNPVKLRWSKLKPEGKHPIQEVISRKIWPTWKLIGDSGDDERRFTQKVFQLMNPTLGAPADTAAEIACEVQERMYLLFQCHSEQHCVSDEGQDRGMVDSTQKNMPDMDKLQAIVTRDIDLVVPADGAAPDENMELFIWWWD